MTFTFFCFVYVKLLHILWKVYFSHNSWFLSRLNRLNYVYNYFRYSVIVLSWSEYKALKFLKYCQCASSVILDPDVCCPSGLSSIHSSYFTSFGTRAQIQSVEHGDATMSPIFYFALLAALFIPCRMIVVWNSSRLALGHGCLSMLAHRHCWVLYEIGNVGHLNGIGTNRQYKGP